MKSLYIFTIAILTTLGGYAQRTTAHAQPIETINPYNYRFSNGLLRTTGIGDTLALHNIPDTASLVLYTVGANADSGYVTGTDIWNDIGFAEHYYINGNDSSVSVIGVFAQFGGSVNSSSTQTVTFNLWSENPPVAITDTLLYNAMPGNVLDSIPVGATQLGIGPVKDTLKLFLFPVPAQMFSSFFVGYSTYYNFAALSGESTMFGLASSRDSVPGNDYVVKMDTFTFVNIDTISLSTDTLTDTTENIILNVRNATLGADNTWYDNLTQNDSLRNHLAIYPVVAINAATGVASVTKNNLTFFGNYPNPARDYTNIRFALSCADDVSIQVMDMTGRNTGIGMPPTEESAGVHIVPLQLSGLPPGNYVYLIHTSSGAGIAGEITVRP